MTLPRTSTTPYGRDHGPGQGQVMVAHRRALWEAGAQVDVVPVTADLVGNDVVVGPLLHMVRGDSVQRLEDVRPLHRGHAPAARPLGPVGSVTP